MWDVVLDALVDSAKMLPFLLAIYLLIEYLETVAKAKDKTIRLLNGKFSPLVAGAVGIVPQCGFSVMATNLYLQNYVKLGTLVAFLIATSDEALPLLFASPYTIGVVWQVIVIKVVYAVLCGYVINLFGKNELATSYELDDKEGCCHHELSHEHCEHKGFWHFVKHPVLHTLKITVYIFAVNVAFGLLIYFVGEDKIASFTGQAVYVQPLVAALVGLIPNCGSSVVLTGMYTSGVITFGALISGLSANSGIALAVLLRDKTHVKRNLGIVALLYGLGVLVGYIVYLAQLI